MPTYFLEIAAGPQSVRDEQGAEYQDVHTARRDLVSAMTQILHQSVAARHSRDIIGQIRDAQGTEIYSATLELRCQDTNTSIKLGASVP